ncbi:restriction endonuclease subunit S [Campylobacter coli]
MYNQTLQEKYPHLEISVLKLSEAQKDNESKRIDSEFFKKEYFDAMETIQLNQVEYLSDNTKFNSRYSQPKYDETSKMKVINSQYIRNEYIDYENAKSGYGKIVPKESVLINATGIGTLGRVFINILDFDFSIDSHINIIVVKNKTYLNPYFLTIFLQSYYGQIQIIRYYSGTSGQIEIYPRDFNYFKIPIFSMEFQLEIEKMVKDSHKALEESKELYKKAEEILYNELGLDPKNPLQSLLNSKTNNSTNSPNISIRTLKESFLKTGRLDSEYYQSKYEDIENFIKSYSNGYDSFLNIINNKDTNFTPKNNENYNYIELANIGNNGNINEPISDLGKNLPTRARRIVSNGDVIISSIEGSLSSCALITQEFDKHLVSTGFFVLNSKLLNSETLLVMFKSQIFQEYLKKFPSGTILCAINKEELSKIFIPKIDPTTQEKIAKYIQESFNLRKKSKQLLDNAKIKVEEQIQGKV